jgi:cobaltochelatase CobN
MHRPPTTSGPADLDGDAPAFLTHPPADLVLLSSAETDLLALARVVERRSLPFRVQGLPLAKLTHPAVVDHYLSHSLAGTRVVVVRLLGGRGHWSYGIDQLRLWQDRAPGRQLLVLAGTPEEDGLLGSLASVGEALNLSLARCFRIVGEANLLLALEALGVDAPATTPAAATPSAPAQ